MDVCFYGFTPLVVKKYRNVIKTHDEGYYHEEEH